MKWHATDNGNRPGIGDLVLVRDKYGMFYLCKYSYLKGKMYWEVENTGYSQVTLHTEDTLWTRVIPPTF